MTPRERRLKERELLLQVRGGAGRIFGIVSYMQRAGRADAVTIARQLRDVRADVDLALELAGELDHRART